MEASRLQAVERITQMERIFDTLQEALERNPAALGEDASLREALEALTRYYEGGLWLRDYELDEKGLLPGNLKRGILSQDGLYDFLGRIGQNTETACKEKYTG